MKSKRIICDLCGGTVDNRRETGFKLKAKCFGLDYIYHRTDICYDCMNKIVGYVKHARE